MCNYPEETHTVHVDGQPCPPLQSTKAAENEAASTNDIQQQYAQFVDGLAHVDKSEQGALTQKGTDFLGIRLTEEEAKANGDLQLKFCGFAKEIEAEQAKCPMAEAEDQEIEDMCSARRIIPDEQPTDRAEEPVDVLTDEATDEPAEQTVGQPIAESNFSAQEEAAIMAEVDKRVAEISNQLQEKYTEKVQERTDELDKLSKEYLAKKEKELVDHVDKKSNEYYLQLMQEQHQTLNTYFTTLWSCWSQLPDDVKAKLGGIDFVKKNAAKAEQELNATRLHNELNYDAESLVDRIGDKYKKNGHISDEDLSTLASDPSMLSNFILHYVPMAERSKFEWTLQALKEQHPEMQWNVQALNIEDGGTMNFCGLPNMSDTVLSSSNEKVCTVADIYETQLKHYKEANDSMKIGTKLDPKTVSYWDAQLPPQQDQRKVAQQCSKPSNATTQCSKPEVDAWSARQPAVRMLSNDMVKDMPKSMVDKITSIANEYWSHQYRDHWFDLLYNYSTRYILITVNFNAMTDDSADDFLSIEYRNNGIGAIDYAMKFKKMDDLLDCGPNGRRFYEWLAVVVNAFFNK